MSEATAARHGRDYLRPLAQELALRRRDLGVDVTRQPTVPDVAGVLGGGDG